MENQIIADTVADLIAMRHLAESITLNLGRIISEKESELGLIPDKIAADKEAGIVKEHKQQFETLQEQMCDTADLLGSAEERLKELELQANS